MKYISRRNYGSAFPEEIEMLKAGTFWQTRLVSFSMKSALARRWRMIM